MDASQFWKIIEPGKDSEEPETILAAELSKLSSTEVFEFQNLFDQFFDDAYIWALWGAAYLIQGGCSDDGFIDFRYGLISKGRKIYENAVSNPDSLADFISDNEIENEMFGYVAQEVYTKITSNEMPLVVRNAPDDPAGEEWDFDDEAENEKRLPRLANIHQ